jgi:hypothetical protein
MIAGSCAVGMLLVYLPFAKGKYLRGVMVAVDRLNAATIPGWGEGQYTISAMCGGPKKDCRFCKLICGFIGKFLDPNHCVKYAKKEGLIE